MSSQKLLFGLKCWSPAGAKIFITGSPGTTDDDTAAAIVETMGVHVYTTRDESFEQHLTFCEHVLAATPDLIADNGADLHNLIYSDSQYKDLRKNLLGATEETTTGATRLIDKIRCRDFPTLIINHTQAKRIVENRYGVGSSVVDGIMRATNVMLHGKNGRCYWLRLLRFRRRATVSGYGRSRDSCGDRATREARGSSGRLQFSDA